MEKREIKDWSKYFIYENGDIESHWGKTPKLLKANGATQNRKYRQVCLTDSVSKKISWLYVHRLTYEAFVEPIKENYTIDHIDGDASNNHYTNLQQMTLSNNVKKHFKECPGVFLRKHRDSIIKDYKTLGTYRKVGDKWNIGPGTVWNLINK